MNLKPCPICGKEIEEEHKRSGASYRYSVEKPERAARGAVVKIVCPHCGGEFYNTFVLSPKEERHDD